MTEDLSKHYEYKNYEEYLKYQAKKGKRTWRRTNKYVNHRNWIYSKIVEYGVVGSSVLCVGARADAELDFFKEKGYQVDGIDLFESGSVMKCDMSRMYEFPYFKDKKYDIVFSHEAMEHCLDFNGFVKGLNQVCGKFFVCFCPKIEVVTPWDCSIHNFMSNVDDSDVFKKNLKKDFPEFSIVFCTYSVPNNKIFFILKKNYNFKET